MPDDAPKKVLTGGGNLTGAAYAKPNEEEPDPRPEPRTHTIKAGETLEKIGKAQQIDKTRKSWYDSDKGGGTLAEWNRKILREKDGSKISSTANLDGWLGRKIWVEPPLAYTKRLNEWYNRNPDERPKTIELPTVVVEAETNKKDKKSKKWFNGEDYANDNVDFNAWKKEYSLPDKMTLQEAQRYWRENLMRKWAEQNPDLVVYDLSTKESDAIDFDSTDWEWYKTTPYYKADQEKIARHLMNFGNFLAVEIEVLAGGFLPPPVRFRKPTISKKGSDRNQKKIDTTTKDEAIKKIDMWLRKPEAIWGESAERIKNVFNAAGFKAEIVKSVRGSAKARQVRIVEHNINNIQVHPGGGSHGGRYYKISTSDKGVLKIARRKTYSNNREGAEKATFYWID